MYIDNDDFSVWMQKLYAKLEELCKDVRVLRNGLMQQKPGFDRYQSGCAGDDEDCGTCRFFNWHRSSPGAAHKPKNYRKINSD